MGHAPVPAMTTLGARDIIINAHHTSPGKDESSQCRRTKVGLQIYFSAVNFNDRVRSMRWGFVLGIH